MKVNEKNKDSIERLHLLSGESKGRIQELFKHLVVLISLNLLEGESTNIPFLGDLKLSHVRNEIIDYKAKAVVESKLVLDDSMLRLIYDITEDQESAIEDLIKNKIRNELSTLLEN